MLQTLYDLKYWEFLISYAQRLTLMIHNIHTQTMMYIRKCEFVPTMPPTVFCPQCFVHEM